MLAIIIAGSKAIARAIAVAISIELAICLAIAKALAIDCYCSWSSKITAKPSALLLFLVHEIL